MTELAPGGPLTAPVAPVYPVLPWLLPRETFVSGRFRVRCARTATERDAALRLRFEVFNLELAEGLASSWLTGRDEDSFDAVCHHLLVEDTVTGRVAGTYRMQTSEMAGRYSGFYSAGEFELGGLGAGVLAASVEIGRVCIAREHRHRRTLFLLWQGLAAYACHTGKRYLFGCCSLPGLDPAAGLEALAALEREGHMHPTIRVEPREELACRLVPGAGGRTTAPVELPPLFRTYLRFGAKACGPPALDRVFGTTDFLVVLDTEALASDVRTLFFGEGRR